MKVSVWSEVTELPSGNVIRIDYQDDCSIEIDMPISLEELKDLVVYIQTRKG